MLTLRVSEIFYSLQGESNHVGLPTAFVRLTGCPLRCTYCDTTYAFKGGNIMPLTAILETVSNYNPRYVTVTGGEPLAQKSCTALLKQLCDTGYHVSLETSGAIDISEVDQRVVKVVDLKTPGSGESEHNLYANLDYLRPHDQIKFVICNNKDYAWAKAKLQQYKLAERCEVLFSSSYQQQSARELADNIVADNLPVRFQVQLHKYLWGEVAGK